MNELVTQQRAVAIAQSSQGASLVDIRRDAATYPRIKDYEPMALLQQIKSLILMVCGYKGYTPPGGAKDIDAMASLLVGELLTDEFGDDLKELTMEEIRRALRKAALGKGAEMYGIKVESLYRAIADYRHDEVKEAHQRVMAERRASKATPAELESIHAKYAAMMAEAAKERGL